MPSEIPRLSDFPEPDHEADLEGLLAPGQVLDGRYEIVREIGEGAAGMVYQARHRLIDRKVAIKVLNASLKENVDAVNRFINEGRAAGALGHPHIVESTDMGYTPSGSPYLVLEYLEGRDVLEDVEASGPLELSRALRIAAQTASALVAAHAKGIIHRDVKPANVYLVQRLGREDHVKVLDFGVSKFSTAGITKAGALYGTAEFMAPEQISATEMVDARADVYGLGLTLYYMLSGQLPFDDLPVQEMLRAVVDGAAIPLSDWRDDLPDEVYELVDQCIAKNPNDRFQTMAELGSALTTLSGTVSMSEQPPTSSRHGGPASLRHGLPSIPDGGAVDDATASASVAQVTVQTLSGPSIETGMTTSRPHPRSSSARRVFGVVSVGVLVVTAAVVGGSMLRRTSSSPSAPAAPTEVTFDVTSPPGSKMMFRGRQFVLPFKGKLARGTERERVDVTLPDGESRTFWVTLDGPRQVAVAP